MVSYLQLKRDLHTPFLLGRMLSQALQQLTFSIGFFYCVVLFRNNTTQQQSSRGLGARELFLF